MCISRFETETRDAFLDLYTKIDAGEIDPDAEENKNKEVNADEDPGPIPF